MSRKLTIDIDHIDPRVGDTFGFDVTNNGIYLGFTGGTGWDKTFVEDGDTQEDMLYITKFDSDLTLDNIYQNFNGIVYDSVIQTDGKLIVVGDFTEYSGISTPRITRFNTDGTLDPLPNLGTGPNNTVRAITLGSGNEIYIGGDFTAVGTNLVNRICRLTNTGNPNLTFISIVMGSTLDKGFNDSVRALTYYSGGLYIGGKFTKFKGSNRNRLVRLNSNGSEDTALVINDGFTNVSNDSLTVINSILVRTITVLGLPSTRLFIGGLFSKYKTTTNCNNIVKLQTNGTLDVDFNQGVAGSGTNGVVNKIIGADSNNLVIGGEFTTFDSVASRNIVLSQNDGFIVPANVFDDGFDLGGQVKDIIENGGNFVVGGDMIGYQGLNCGNLVTIDKSSGSLVDHFKLNNTINALSLNGSDIIAVGKFTQITVTGGSSSSFLTIPLGDYINVDFGDGFLYGGITKTLIQDDDKILAVGYLTSYNGDSIPNNYIRLESDGQLDVSYNLTTLIASNINDISIQPDGKILYLGTFENPVTLNLQYRVVRLNSSGDIDNPSSLSLTSSTTFNNTVSTMCLQPDGKILVGGSFTNYASTNRNRIGRLNSDGTRDTGFNIGTGFNSTGPKKIVLQPDGKILVGGYFTTYNSISAVGFCRLNSDGTRDTSLSVGTGFSPFSDVITVRDMIIQPDGKILVGGAFNIYNGTTVSNIIRLESDGTLDTSFNIGSGFINIGPSSTVFINTICLQPDGKILVGGRFNRFNGTTVGEMIRLESDGTLDTSFNIGAGFNNDVMKIIINNDGKILVTGYFNGFNSDTSVPDCIILLDNDGSYITTYVDIPQTIQNTYNNLVEFNTTTGVTYSIVGNSVVMEYTFDDEQIVVEDVYDTPDHVELLITNESITINELIDEIVTKSNHEVKTTETDPFEFTNFKIRMYEGDLFSGVTGSVAFNFNKPKVSPDQTNIYIEISDLIRSDFEWDPIDFITPDFSISKNLPENVSKWVYVEETNYQTGATVSLNLHYMFAIDGYLYNREEQHVPNLLVSSRKRYLHLDQTQRIYFQVNFLNNILVQYSSGLSFIPTFNINIDLDNKKYVQSLQVVTRPNERWVDYIFEYDGNSLQDPVTEVIRYYFYNGCMSNGNNQIIFKNKWGVLESLMVNKRRKDSISVESKDFTRSIVDFNGDYNTRRHTKTNFNIMVEESFSVNTDALPEYMNDVMYNLYESRDEVWLYDGDEFIPVLIDGDFEEIHRTDDIVQYTIKLKGSHKKIKNFK